MKKKLSVIQEEISDCGACCLLSIIRFYNGNVPLEQLRIDTLTNATGVTALNIIECAKKYGFIAKGVKVENIERINLPCIAHFNINNSLSHFVCIYKINEDNILIMDPAKGLINISYQEFNNYFSKVIISLYPKCQIPKYTCQKYFRNCYLNILKNKKKTLTLIIIFSILLTLIVILLSYKVNFLMLYPYFSSLVICIIIISVKELLFYKINHQSFTFNKVVSEEITNNFFTHIVNLPLNYLHIKDPGEVVKRLEDISNIKDVVNTSIISIILNISILIIVTISLGYLSTILAIILLLSLIIYIIISLLITKNISHLIINDINVKTEYQNRMINAIYSLKSIIHANASNFIKERINKSFNETVETSLILKNKILLLEIIKDIILSLSEIIIYFILILLTQRKVVSLTNLISIFFLLNLFFDATHEIADNIPDLNYIRKLISKVDEFYTIKKEDGINAFTFGDIVFKNVSFSYNSYQNTFDYLNFQIKKSEKVAIKGGNGTGKSTICRLINQEYINYQGKIFIDNKELRNISHDSIQEHIAYISQEEKIILGTIRDNITLGQNIREEKLNNIIQICKLDKLLESKNHGIDTFLYGGGEELSGGERQKIILARTLVRNCNIYIMDEALSEVNINDETCIINNLIKYLSDKTIIYVTHKNNIELFDRVICIERSNNGIK